MNIYKNGYVVDTVQNIHVTAITEQVYLNSFHKIGADTLTRVLKGDIVIPVFRLYLLHDNEQIRMDASEDLISGSLSVQYQTGQRRTMNVTLVNSNNKWTPKPVSGLIWVGSKFRFDTGLVIGNVIYWKQQGIFLLKDASMARDNSNQTISLSLCDKFGMLDGGVYGKTSLKTIIPVGVPISQAFTSLLQSDRGNGDPYDFKSIMFNSQYISTPVYYTVKQDVGNTIGDILIEMGKTISSDVFYDEYGSLNIQSNINEFISSNFPIIYRFNEGDRDVVSANITYNTSQVRNKVIVKGAVTNGYQFSATAENRNLKSDYCIQYNGIIPEIVNDSKLYSDQLCMERAMYDLVNYTRGTKTLNISGTYLPLLDVNQSVMVYFPSLGLYNENYVIDSVSLNIGDGATSVTMTNINEVIF